MSGGDLPPVVVHLRCESGRSRGGSAGPTLVEDLDPFMGGEARSRSAVVPLESIKEEGSEIRF